jgi:SAM-dependent methyltransferase
MTSTWDKYAGGAEGWSDDAYADARTYLARRAELVRTLGPRLAPGDSVLDLACGDGGLADFLPEQRYRGVDASPEMVEAAHRRGRDVVHADLNDYEPDEPVSATTIFRAIYYARDRAGLLERICAYTEKKLVFDLNPRQYRLADVRTDLRAAGFDRLALRPFFVPQTRALPRPLALLFRGLEHSGPFARLVLRARFTYLCAAWAGAGTKR